MPKHIFDNRLYYGDNLEVLRKYIGNETVDLCYIDPPFNSNRTYNQIYLNKGSEDKAQAQAFTDTWVWDATAIKGYKEILENQSNRFTTQTVLLIEGLEKVIGRDSLLAYLIHITLRVTEIHRVLKNNGSIYLHCDPTASHYLKLILDTVFVANGGEFVNELIWCYSIGGRSKNNFGEKHDIIFWYSKGDKWIFNGDDPGVRISRKPNSHMKTETDKDGITWQVKTDRKTKKVYRYPLDKTANDYWTDIEQLNREDAERLGYPTQKPEVLLERILRASSKEGDTILDAYCGCGTTATVSEKTHRKWIGIDITYQSISLILKRLEDEVGKTCLQNIELTGVPKDWESAKALAEKPDDKTRKEFEKWAVLYYSNNRARINEKKGGDGGIDGIALIQDYDKEMRIENKKIIFSVKSDKILIPAYVNQLKGKMHDENIVIGILICLNEPTKGMLKEAKEMGMYKNTFFDLEYPRLQIVTVKEMFDENKRLNIPVIEIVKSADFSGKENKAQLKLL